MNEYSNIDFLEKVKRSKAKFEYAKKKKSNRIADEYEQSKINEAKYRAYCMASPDEKKAQREFRNNQKLDRWI